MKPGMGVVVAALLVGLAGACKPARDGDPRAHQRETAQASSKVQPAVAAENATIEAAQLADDATTARDTTPVDADVVAVRLSDRGDTQKHVLGTPVIQFSPQDTVYAEIETRGSASGYTIYAKWIGPDGAELADYGMRVEGKGSRRTVISLSKPDGWTSGQGRIEIAINGELEETAIFQVQ